MNYILKVLNGEMTMEEYPIQKDEVMNVVATSKRFTNLHSWAGKSLLRNWTGKRKLQGIFAQSTAVTEELAGFALGRNATGDSARAGEPPVLVCETTTEGEDP